MIACFVRSLQRVMNCVNLNLEIYQSECDVPGYECVMVRISGADKDLLTAQHTRQLQWSLGVWLQRTDPEIDPGLHTYPACTTPISSSQGSFHSAHEFLKHHAGLL